MLITEDYRKLNAQMHDECEEFGAQGGRWATDILHMATEFTEKHGIAPSILDYGCGKGTLKEALAGLDVHEYDPAIPGKDEKPDAADIVVCGDVLEHIEPDCLQYVLHHLQQVTKHKLFFCIATKPAKKTLPDGTNTHKIIQPAGFWLTALANFFNVDWFKDQNSTQLVGVATPLYAVMPIQYSMAVTNEERNAQVKVNVERIEDRLVANDDRRSILPDNGKTVHLCCGGPSLRDTWMEAKRARRDDPDGVDIATVSIAHKFMTDMNCCPDIHIDADPRAHKAGQIGEPQERVEYWLASCIHPDYLDKLEGYKVKLWHAYNGEESRVATEWEPRQRMIVGGGSVGLRALSVLYYVGYRKFVVHGLDGSHSQESDQYAAPHHGPLKQEIEVRVGTRWFKTSPPLMVYSRYFFKQIECMKDADIQLRGDGMLQHMLKVQGGAGAIETRQVEAA